jgi:signal peptidase I
MRKKILILGLVLVLVGVVSLIGYRVFFLKMVRVPSGSMANTIIPGDHLVIRRVFGLPGRGDIVIFKYPDDPSTVYISRIVGLPGEKIEMGDRSIYINGSELGEQRVTVKFDPDFEYGAMEEISTEGSGPYRVFYFPRANADVSRRPSDVVEMSFGTKEPFRIPDHHYFVMGDNRDNSIDSRMRGPVPRESIWGKATRIYWSSNLDKKSHQEKIRWERINTGVK